MATKFYDAPEARQIAEELIPQYHARLMEAQLTFAFTTQKRSKNGKRVLGSASKLSPKERFLMRALLPGAEDTDEDAELPAFLILLDADAWPLLSKQQRTALVDHELCHCIITEDTDGNPQAAIRAHDVEEFADIIQRHGLWQPDVAHFATVVQASLFDREAGGAASLGTRTHLDVLKLEVIA